MWHDRLRRQNIEDMSTKWVQWAEDDSKDNGSISFISVDEGEMIEHTFF